MLTFPSRDRQGQFFCSTPNLAFLLLLLAAAVSCLSHPHSSSQALKLSTLWWYNSSRTACVLKPHLCFTFLLYALLFYCCRCLITCRRLHHTVPLKPPSSLLCASHGTTAIAQQVCVDHFYACVLTLHIYAYSYVRCVCMMGKHATCATATY